MELIVAGEQRGGLLSQQSVAFQSFFLLGDLMVIVPGNDIPQGLLIVSINLGIERGLATLLRFAGLWFLVVLLVEEFLKLVFLLVTHWVSLGLVSHFCGVAVQVVCSELSIGTFASQGYVDSLILIIQLLILL